MDLRLTMAKERLFQHPVKASWPQSDESLPVMRKLLGCDSGKTGIRHIGHQGLERPSAVDFADIAAAVFIARVKGAAGIGDDGLVASGKRF